MAKGGLKPDAIFQPGENRTVDRLDKLAWLMDRAITIPGTRISFGLDALLGLLPVGGDVMTGAVQAALVLVAMHHFQVPKAIAARMAANVLLDIGLGSLPIVGDLFDVYFKANTRNMKLLNEVVGHLKKGQTVPAAPSVRYLVGLGALFGLAIAAVLAVFIALIVWLYRSWHQS